MIISDHAIIENPKNIGNNTSIWHFTHIRDTATIGKDCTIGSHCYIDKDVEIGNSCKIQSGCLIYHPAKIGNCVFIGPRCIIINDKYPRATNNDGTKLSEADWTCSGVIIEDFASIGAGSIIMPGIVIGHHAMIGAGSLVTHNVLPYLKVYGSPAKVI